MRNRHQSICRFFWNLRRQLSADPSSEANAGAVPSGGSSAFGGLAAGGTAPVNTSAPTISPATGAVAGTDLVGAVGTWDWKGIARGAPAFNIRWERDGLDLNFGGLTYPGANVTPGNYKMFVQAINANGETSPWAVSAPSAVVNPPAPVIGTVSINQAANEITISGVTQPGTVYIGIDQNQAVQAGSNIKSGVLASGFPAQASVAAGAGGTVTVPVDLTGLVAADYYVHVTVEDSVGQFATDVPTVFTFVPDTTAPVLSAPTDAANGQTASTASVSTNENNGTLFVVVTTSSTPPTAAQVKAGLDSAGVAAAFAASQPVSAGGVQTVSPAPSGLTAGTAYTTHFMHEDASGNQSIVASAAGFTTAAAAGSGPSVRATNNTAGVNASSVAVNMPAGVAVGDKLLVAIGHGNGVTVSAPGWTQIATQALTSGTTRTLTVFERTADGTEGTTQTFTFAGGWSEAASVAVAMQGATTVGTPVAGTGAYAASYTGPTAPVAANSAALTFFLQNSVISGAGLLDGVDAGAESVAVFGSTGLAAGTSPAFTATGTGAATWAGITVEVS